MEGLDSFCQRDYGSSEDCLGRMLTQSNSCCLIDDSSCSSQNWRWEGEWNQKTLKLRWPLWGFPVPAWGRGSRPVGRFVRALGDGTGGTRKDRCVLDYTNCGQRSDFRWEAMWGRESWGLCSQSQFLKCPSNRLSQAEDKVGVLSTTVQLPRDRSENLRKRHWQPGYGTIPVGFKMNTDSDGEVEINPGNGDSVKVNSGPIAWPWRQLLQCSSGRNLFLG